MELSSRPPEARSYNVSPTTMLDQLKTTNNMTPDLIKFMTQSTKVSPTAKTQPLKAYTPIPLSQQNVQLFPLKKHFIKNPVLKQRTETDGFSAPNTPTNGGRSVKLLQVHPSS
jgi:hypothetical protein